jgi:hypothetical protein
LRVPRVRVRRRFSASPSNMSFMFDSESATGCRVEAAAVGGEAALRTAPATIGEAFRRQGETALSPRPTNQNRTARF